MRPIYINARTAQGRETVDSVDPDPEYWPTPRAMRKEAARLVSEYHLCGIAAYTSTRPCANWKG